MHSESVGQAWPFWDEGPEMETCLRVEPFTNKLSSRLVQQTPSNDCPPRGLRVSPRPEGAFSAVPAGVQISGKITTL